MAVLSSVYPTFADLAARMDQNGRIVTVIEALKQTNPILQDMRFVECNKEDGYLTSVRTGLPDVTWRKLYGGVQPSKSATATVTDTCGNLEAYSEVDKDLADVNGNSAQWRASEDEAFLQAMNNTMASTLFYGDTGKNPERFLGLAARYADKKATNGRMIVDAGGKTKAANTSVWIVSWGNGVSGIYPKASQAGLKAEDLGQVTVTKSDGSLYEAYRTHFKWSIGLTVKDWRAVARVANIDVATLQALGEDGSNDLLYKLIDAKNALDPQYLSGAVMYCNRTVYTALEKMALNKSSHALNIVEAAGQFETRFLGIPIRCCDAITNTEAAI